jgi:hypothetical protein
MRDSIDARGIPQDTPVVAGYGDGRYVWSPSWADGSNWWDLFPNAVQLSIVVSAADQGDILDVEPGNATPAECPGWCDRFNRPGRRAPTIYTNRATWPQVQAAVGSRRVDYWISTLDGTQQVAGAVAVQYTDVGAYDESAIWDGSWVGMQTIPNQGTPLEVDELLVRFSINGGTYLSNGLTYRWIIDQYDNTALSVGWGPNINDVGNVNGFKGFGVPADPTTAKLSGQAWPPTGPAEP